MQKTKILLAMTMVIFVVGCPLPQDGTLTVTVSSFPVNGGHIRVTVETADGLQMVGKSDGIDGVISGGSGSSLVKTMSLSGNFIGTGGSSYRMLIIIDQNNNGTLGDSGDYYYTAIMPPSYPTVTIDGDTTFNTVGTDYSYIP